MNLVNEAASFLRVTASGVAVAASGPVALMGVFVPAVLTGQIVQLWNGSATGTPVIGTATLAANGWYALPAMLPGGLTYCVTNEDVDLTLFYTPMSRT